MDGSQSGSTHLGQSFQPSARSPGEQLWNGDADSVSTGRANSSHREAVALRYGEELLGQVDYCAGYRIRQGTGSGQGTAGSRRF